MKKYIYILIWAVLCLILSIFWSDIKEAANASRPCEAVGGEYFLWLMPTEIVYALSMAFGVKGGKSGNDKLS